MQGVCANDMQSAVFAETRTPTQQPIRLGRAKGQRQSHLGASSMTVGHLGILNRLCPQSCHALPQEIGHVAIAVVSEAPNTQQETGLACPMLEDSYCTEHVAQNTLVNMDRDRLVHMFLIQALLAYKLE